MFLGSQACRIPTDNNDHSAAEVVGIGLLPVYTHRGSKQISHGDGDQTIDERGGFIQRQYHTAAVPLP